MPGLPGLYFSATRSRAISIPFLAEDFQRMVCVWDHNFDRAVVEHELPAVVITELVERSLEWELPND